MAANLTVAEVSALGDAIRSAFARALCVAGEGSVRREVWWKGGKPFATDVLALDLVLGVGRSWRTVSLSSHRRVVGTRDGKSRGSGDISHKGSDESELELHLGCFGGLWKAFKAELERD